MPQMRYVSTLAVVAVIGATASLHAQGQLELTGAFVASEKPGPLERQAKAISPANPIPRRIGYVVPIYPAEAAAVETRLVVTLRLTLDASG